MSLVPLLNQMREIFRSKVGIDGLVGIDLPRIREVCVVRHVLADGEEVDPSGDAQTCELGRITNSREHEKLWSVEHSRAQDDLSTGRHLPSLTLCPVNEGVRVIW